MGESKDTQIQQEIADEGYEPDPLTIPPYYGVETQVVDRKLKILKPSDREPVTSFKIPEGQTAKLSLLDAQSEEIECGVVISVRPDKETQYDPDHLNPSKGGNQASDDYWQIGMTDIIKKITKEVLKNVPRLPGELELLEFIRTR